MRQYPAVLVLKMVLTTQPQTAMSTCNAAVTHSPLLHNALRPSSLMMTATRADQPQAHVMTCALLSRVKMAENPFHRIRLVRLHQFLS